MTAASARAAALACTPGTGIGLSVARVRFVWWLRFVLVSPLQGVHMHHTITREGMSKQGRATIARIQKGLLPSGLSCWPADKVGSSPNFIEL